LRERLLAEIEALPSAGDATEWIGRILPLRSRLPSDDVRLIDDAFAAKRGAFGDEWESSVANSDGGLRAADETRRTGSVARPPTPKCTRIKDRDHRTYVASRPCAICGRSPSDAHHLRFAQPRALGRKVSDEFTVPLCRTHHRQLHRTGNEKAWWEESKFDPVPLAEALWMDSRGSRPPANGHADERT
jgi:hypothetical protein